MTTPSNKVIIPRIKPKFFMRMPPGAVSYGFFIIKSFHRERELLQKRQSYHKALLRLSFMHLIHALLDTLHTHAKLPKRKNFAECFNLKAPNYFVLT